MKIKTLTTIATATLSVLLLLLLFILYQILDIEHYTIRGQEKRFESFKLADELRQSSDADAHGEHLYFDWKPALRKPVL